MINLGQHKRFVFFFKFAVWNMGHFGASEVSILHVKESLVSLQQLVI